MDLGEWRWRLRLWEVLSSMVDSVAPAVTMVESGDCIHEKARCFFLAFLFIPRGFGYLAEQMRLGR